MFNLNIHDHSQCSAVQYTKTYVQNGFSGLGLNVGGFRRPFNHTRMQLCARIVKRQYFMCIARGLNICQESSDASTVRRLRCKSASSHGYKRHQ